MNPALTQGMAGVRDHSELQAFKLADQARQRVRRWVGHGTLRPDPGLEHQLKEAAESACANIAEGFSRYHPRDFARFLRMAKGSLSELVVHLERAAAQQLVPPQEAEVTASLARRSRGAITRLILYLEKAEAPGVKR